MADKRPQKQQENDPSAYQNRLNLRMTLRVAVLVYLAWLAVELIRGYLNGKAGLSLPVVIAAVAAFALAGAFIAITSKRQYDRGMEKAAQMWREKDEAELADLEDDLEDEQ